MGIQKDAEELLVYLYKLYVDNDTSLKKYNNESMIIETKWDKYRINRLFS